MVEPGRGRFEDERDTRCKIATSTLQKYKNKNKKDAVAHLSLERGRAASLARGGPQALVGGTARQTSPLA